MTLAPYIALADTEWFHFLSSQADARGRLDEVNFWNPSGKPLKTFSPGEPMFLRLKRPHYVIAGYGFFAHFTRLRLDEAWEYFGEKNGGSQIRFYAAIAHYLGKDLAEVLRGKPVIGCTILRDAVFWKPDRWIPWGPGEGWQSSQMRGATERNPDRATRLLGEIVRDHQEPPPELISPFVLREIDDRKIQECRVVRREGQGTFRAVLLDAYGRRCSITGERTEPVLDAAHIQPYSGPQSNHVQNGLLLTQEFHTLFDKGYVTVTPDHHVLVSRRLREDWANGRRYYEYDGRPLVQLPDDPCNQPSREALAWHAERRFLR